jgi:glycine/D-amino acid oxidase-like deaminating enzyme
MGSMGEMDEHWEVVVVGGGFCGCWALNSLRKKGFKVHLYEWGSALGGK